MTDSDPGEFVLAVRCYLCREYKVLDDFIALYEWRLSDENRTYLSRTLNGQRTFYEKYGL